LRIATSLAPAILLVGSYGASAQQALVLPSAVAYDPAGDLFFVDTNRNQAFEVSLAGVLTTVAGTGVQGFAGDGGAATDAELNSPQGITVGEDGTVYIADTGNQRIRSITSGQINTYAGTGLAGFSGDNGPATAAKLSQPTALATDGQGNLLLCDTANHRIRSISASGVIATVAGTGVQGFSGDGSAAISAELDSPAGIAVAKDGRIFVADTHNHRLRVIATDNTIETFAGTGSMGYSGDGGAAAGASLALPRGISLDAAGDVIFADSNNQRIRSINAQGIISTIAGSGVQGFAADGTSSTVGALNTPRGVAISSFGDPVFADSPNRLVREVATNGDIYTIAVAPVSRSTAVALTASPSMVYGNASALVAVSGSAATPQGTVTVQSGSATIANALLSGGAATVAGLALPAGAYLLTASYSGDGLNPAATSPAAAVTVAPAPVTATANAATISYGQPIPALTGLSKGILPQDASSVSIAFTTTATVLDPVGSYPITAAMTGAASSNYSLTVSPSSGSLNIVPAQSTLTLQPLNQTFYAGQSVLLTASLGSVTTGVPTGEVDFADGGTVVAKGTAINGIASGSYVPSSQGGHTLTATYAGDRNFLGSTSSGVTTTVAALPDFTISPGITSQTVQGGLIASYPIALASLGDPFTGSVSFSAAGLPSGVTASFSPTAVVPGASGATVTLNLQTIALARLHRPGLVDGRYGLFLYFCLPFFAFRRRRGSSGGDLWMLLLGVALLGLVGCGERTIATGVTHSQTSTVTITATSTNIAGSIVVHATTVSLTVE
jgi:sugar lactone lactonase YvrE